MNFLILRSTAYTYKGPRLNKTLIWSVPDRTLLVIRSVSNVLWAQSRFVKFVGDDAAGRTPYTFYKPTLGLKYVSNRPYNKFIPPTTFVSPIIGIFNGFMLPNFDVGYTLDSKYAVT